MRPIEDILASVRARGGKITPQRVLIYQALIGDTSHPTAEQLHERLRAWLPHLSLTTVYAALNDLTETGDLRRFEPAFGQRQSDRQDLPDDPAPGKELSRWGLEW